MGILSDKLESARAKATLILMNKGTSFKRANLPEIPKEWETFPGTNDLWKRVDFPEDQDTTAILYQGYSGSVFQPHRHKINVEHGLILNPGGCMEIITTKEIKKVSFPESFFVDKDEPHAARFLKDTLLLVLFHPSMKGGWDAEFMHQNEINVTPSNPSYNQ